jgi:hypothetical protein
MPITWYMTWRLLCEIWMGGDLMPRPVEAEEGE